MKNTEEDIDRGHMALTAVDAFSLSAENDLFRTISNKEIIGHAVDGIGKRLDKEQSIKASLAAEGKSSPIAGNRIAKYTEQLSELGNAKTNDILSFKNISELNLLYYAVHAVLDNLYGETKSAKFSFDEMRVFRQQCDELNTRIIKIEQNKEKEHDNMSKYDISARLNPLHDQSGKVKAMASVTIDNVVAINDLTVVEGKNGLFVGYPQNKDKDGQFRDIVQFLKDDAGNMAKESVEIKDLINKTLVEMYKNNERTTPEKAEQDKQPVMHEIKAFVTPLRDSENATKGLATVQVGDLFKIGSIRVNENTKEGSENFGKNFVAMPSRPDKTAESGYKDVVHPVSKEFGEKLKGAVLKQFDNQVAWKENAAKKEQSLPPRDKPPTTKTASELS